MLTAPGLFALAHGARCEGPHRCLFCGGPCGEQHPSGDYLRDSFTGRDSLPCPGSLWVCAGCVLCFREAADIPLCDGTTRHVKKCAMRAWSWVITGERVAAASKAHLDYLRGVCLNPPDPPFAIALSDSGQKQLLYRGVVCHSREAVTVTLETERVHYRPTELSDRIQLCSRLVAPTGKPALLEAPDARFGMAVLDYWPTDGETYLEEWGRVRETPLSRLAQWLCPNRERCRELYPTPAAPGVGV